MPSSPALSETNSTNIRPPGARTDATDRWEGEDLRRRPRDRHGVIAMELAHRQDRVVVANAHPCTPSAGPRHRGGPPSQAHPSPASYDLPGLPHLTCGPTGTPAANQVSRTRGPSRLGVNPGADGHGPGGAAPPALISIGWMALPSSKSRMGGTPIRCDAGGHASPGDPDWSQGDLRPIDPITRDRRRWREGTSAQRVMRSRASR